MLGILLKLLAFFGVGFLEMFMATQRTYWISKGRSRAAAILVFFESLVAMWLIYQIINNMGNDPWVIVSYAAGNALGTFINLEKVPF